MINDRTRTEIYGNSRAQRLLETLTCVDVARWMQENEYDSISLQLDVNQFKVCHIDRETGETIESVSALW